MHVHDISKVVEEQLIIFRNSYVLATQLDGFNNCSFGGTDA